ncbi:putative G-alpha-domain-containing protein [Lyophyllum shimeji]|uniref:G-alpha-domain-containing protein n=1 Tax=Lyophyllum shimeji TaxID=47721 RepID=A0A9P3UPP8_LYOSH|nr:putative G-alpha-domain-containing protein [Lyophyllum shimeji]
MYVSTVRVLLGLLPVMSDADVDPLSKVLEPPPDETPVQREARLRAEVQAKHVSDAIDEELERQRAVEKKGPRALKVLLLGQSESGKSTTLKNFQILYEHKSFKAERGSWKTVIQLNVVRSIHLILDAMSRAHAEAQARQSHSDYQPRLSQELLTLQMRLAPLLQVEQALTRRLTPLGCGESEATLLNPNSSYADRSKSFAKEIAINSSSPWKGAITRLFGGDTDAPSSNEHSNNWNDPNDPAVVLHACVQDMALLWNDPMVKKLLEKQKLRLQEMAGFFLDSLDRVTSLDYVPSDDDVLRARLKTLGVQNSMPWSPQRLIVPCQACLSIVSPYHLTRVRSEGTGVFLMWAGTERYGNAVLTVRSLLMFGIAAWVPYFDDMDAIIFLAPISAFDQTLAEDPEVNRLEDSINIWKYIVSNKLLKNTNIILFMNKIDLMKTKLESGIRFADFVVSYGLRPNDFENTSQYLRKKFGP